MTGVPPISVVVASWRDTSGLAACLAALAEQADSETDVVVVSSFELPADLVTRHPGYRFIVATDLLTPQLWARGMEAATGRIVAITTGHFTPALDWLARIRAVHVRLRPAGVGGLIDGPRDGGPIAWATYFLRYSSTFCHDREREVSDIPGDNASYDRAALDAHRDSMRAGFWEPDFHRLVRAEGGKLYIDPTIRVAQRGSFTFRAFCRQRLQHGRHFGSTRVFDKPLPIRLFRVLTVPLVPAVLLAKVTGRVLKSRRDLARFVTCLPALAGFILAWAAGEAWGYISPRAALT